MHTAAAGRSAIAIQSAGRKIAVGNQNQPPAPSAIAQARACQAAAGLMSLRREVMELASTHSRCLIDMLLNVHALTNMSRGAGSDVHMQSAADWLPRIDAQLSALRSQLPAPKP